MTNTSPPIYLDNHSTTRVDPRVVEAMLPFFETQFGNAGSTSHAYGWEAKDAVDQARNQISHLLGAQPRELIFTSGATESNNLALKGTAERVRRRGNHLISVKTEHKAVLDPLRRLGRRGFELTWLDVSPATNADAGRIDPQQVADTLRPDTMLVSVMLANNEIGVIQPIKEIGQICKQHGVLLHCDATQAVGRLPIDVEALQVDLLSFSAHKCYGPKGVGGLYVRRRQPLVRLEAMIEGGGQENGLRSGTLNVPGIVGMATAFQIAAQELAVEWQRQGWLRNRLFDGLQQQIADVGLNGPLCRQEESDSAIRLANNLNCSFKYCDGEALMMSMNRLAVSSGSACTSTNPEPSHVLRALGLSDDLTRASLRFGLGRFNTEAEVDQAVEIVADAVHRLRKMSSMA